MKKIFTLFIALTSVMVFSQVTFNPGIRAGVNFSHFSGGNDTYYYYDGSGQQRHTIEYGGRTDFYLGFQGNIRFAKMYALQPEIQYSRQGGTISYRTDNGNLQKENIKVAYLGLQLVNKFYINKFNLHVGPNLEFLVNSKELDNAKLETNYYYFDSSNYTIDLGITAGVGYDFNKNFGIEARIKKGFVPIFDNGNSHSNVVFQTGVYYTFNTKNKD